MNAAARSFDIMPPRIVITEHGADDLADMKGWSSKFMPSGGRPNIRAWKTLAHMWDKLLPGMSLEQAYFENVSYLDDAVYKHFPNVEGQLLFTWSSNNDWIDFDLSTAGQFQGLLEAYATVTLPPIPPVVTPLPPVEKSVTIPLSLLVSIRQELQGDVDILRREALRLGTISDDISRDLDILDTIIRQAIGT